jgi:hypothetical protein
LIGLAALLPTGLCAQKLDTVAVKSIARSMGGDPTITANTSGSFFLATTEKLNPDNQLPTTRYIIVRAFDSKIVEEGSVTMASLKWKSDVEVLVQPLPGQVGLPRGNQTTERIIDLRPHLKGLLPR